MSTKHTPGPWKISNTLSYEIHNGKGIIAYPNQGTKDSGIPNTEARANAHLIASAPELFEAAQIAYACLRRPDSERDENRIVNLLLSAISKAEGRG